MDQIHPSKYVVSEKYLRARNEYPQQKRFEGYFLLD